jgi:hypothetical protein
VDSFDSKTTNRWALILAGGDGERLRPLTRLIAGDVGTWLASALERRGCGSGTPIHFTFKPSTHPKGKTVVITEGALKAETLVSLRPQVHAIATSGISCSHAEIIESRNVVTHL